MATTLGELDSEVKTNLLLLDLNASLTMFVVHSQLGKSPSLRMKSVVLKDESALTVRPSTDDLPKFSNSTIIFDGNVGLYDRSCVHMVKISTVQSVDLSLFDSSSWVLTTSRGYGTSVIVPNSFLIESDANVIGRHRTSDESSTLSAFAEQQCVRFAELVGIRSSAVRKYFHHVCGSFLLPASVGRTETNALYEGGLLYINAGTIMTHFGTQRKRGLTSSPFLHRSDERSTLLNIDP